ncbi:MAG: hypothetical protein AAGJ52_02530 [Pseudomonadota bacterium]
MIARAALLLSSTVLLAACASAPEQRSAASPDPMLQQIAATATGDFATGLDGSGSALLLTVAADPLISADQTLTLNLTQQQAGTAPRQFVLQIERAREAPFELSGVLAPLTSSAQVIAQCPLRVGTSAQGVSATTDAESCRFGEAGGQVGLIKEFLFAGDQIRIADRLSGGPSGSQDTISEQLLRFYRLNRYEGWSGVLEDGSWRVARDLIVDTANGRIEPLDAAGMGLGIIIELDRGELDGDQQPIVRLTVKDSETLETLARSWAAPGARRMGIALPDLQVGLERVLD